MSRRALDAVRRTVLGSPDDEPAVFVHGAEGRASPGDGATADLAPDARVALGAGTRTRCEATLPLRLLLVTLAVPGRMAGRPVRTGRGDRERSAPVQRRPNGQPGRGGGGGARGIAVGVGPLRAGGHRPSGRTAGGAGCYDACPGHTVMAYHATRRSSSVLAPSRACCDMPWTTAAK